MKPIHYAALVLLGAIWGSSFLLIRIAAPDLGPLVLMGGRVSLAFVALFAYASLLRKAPDLRKNWAKYLFVGTMNAALPFSLIAWSELTLTSSLAAIINSTTPLFTAVVAAVWINETLTGRKILGIVLGILGVSILVGGSALEFNSELVFAALASLLAAFCYGIGTVFASRHFTGNAPMHNAIGQLFGATVALSIPATVTLPQATFSSGTLLALLLLSLMATAFAYQLYFFLLNNVGPTRTATVTFLVPVFGTLWGVLFLQEHVTSGMLVGMAVVLTSVGLVTGARFRKQFTRQHEPAAG
ncbi:MAG: EamA family transporter [Anaerolineae bacterium]|nr:EamA family transporter [Anaerolineae bacterium]